jgi:hypothetical protein
LRFPVPALHRNKVWKILLGKTFRHFYESWLYVQLETLKVISYSFLF